MKTINFNMQLMLPDQTNKDIIFNESLVRIDNFLNFTINGFITNTPDKLNIGEKYIITEGDHKNNICYLLHESKNIEYLPITREMLVFCVKSNKFFLYKNKQWNKLLDCDVENSNNKNIQNNNEDNSKFIGIDELFVIPHGQTHLNLYLNKDTEIIFKKLNIPELTIIIKQCYNATHSINWGNNIIWENKAPHIMTQIPNAIDLIKFYTLPESGHFLGKIIAQNYQF